MDKISKTWLILDGNYLAYRAFFTTGALSYGDVMTGVVYGFLRDIITFQSFHQTPHIVFAFDHGKVLRHNDLPTYKGNRAPKKELTEEQVETYRQFKRQLKLLKTEYLTDLGYKNVFYSLGYEADDIIASVCQNLPDGDNGVIISADHDLYQLLNHRISLWKPKEKAFYTHKDLEKDYYGLTPEQWHLVKAMAGCPGDNVPGIQGVGETTAAKFLRGIIKPTAKVYSKIESSEDIWKQNIGLVKLPYKGTPVFTLSEDDTSQTKWNELASKLGMNTLVHRPLNLPMGQEPKPKGFDFTWKKAK